MTERLLVCGLEQSDLGDKRKQNSSRNFNNRNSFCHFTAVLLSNNDLIFALFHTTFQVSEIKKKKKKLKEMKKTSGYIMSLELFSSTNRDQ